ncbi:cell division protein FtsQ/DivIB [Corynebacterium cystitidis]|uniref:cell division protein FtsQ/DivIB n=1 Tax=Corynebacterium cystitidis TaxID=35757 RepID=UPI00211F09AA|nr:FtsQ-type POTRA domain-containing protein [Corynebacterium cystitidis]
MSTAVSPEPEAATARHRRPLWIALASIVIVVALTAVVVLATPLFSVRGYNVEGNDHIPQEQVVDAAGVPVGTNLARADVSASAQAVAGLPWVKSVTVTRGWPSSLNIEITEHQAVAYFVEDDGPHLINAEGVPFAIDVAPPEAVEITGDARADEHARKNAVDIAASIPVELRREVSLINAHDAYNFELQLNDGRVVVWGASEDNLDKSLALGTVVRREGQHFDISNPSLVAVR